MQVKVAFIIYSTVKLWLHTYVYMDILYLRENNYQMKYKTLLRRQYILHSCKADRLFGSDTWFKITLAILGVLLLSVPHFPHLYSGATDNSTNSIICMKIK
jgi:hypothetical protein